MTNRSSSNSAMSFSAENEGNQVFLDAIRAMVVSIYNGHPDLTNIEENLPSDQLKSKVKDLLELDCYKNW